MGDTAVLDGATVEITELEKIEADRVDGVGSPANGIPFLLLKSLPDAAAEVVKGAKDCPKCSKTYDADSKQRTCENCGADLPAADAAPAEKSLPDWHADAVALLKKAMTRGKVNEQPDIDGGVEAIKLLGKLIGYEAQELAAGHLDEIDDVSLLAQAGGLMTAWLSRERSAGMADADAGAMDGALAQSAADDATAKAAQSAASKNDLPDSAFAYIEPGGDKDEDGKTTPRSLRHFPVHDKAHADNAAARIAQGAEFGDKAKAKVAAAQAKFGEDTSKAAVAAEGATVDTEPQGMGDQIAKAVHDAVTKATEPLQERLKALDAELAKVKATPIPGGPALFAAARPSQAAAGEDLLAKARYLRDMADSLSDPEAADGYRQLARQAEEKAKQTT